LNQKPQVIPCKSKEYPPDIFDRFMNLTNVKRGENERATKLILKSYMISLFFSELKKAVLMTHGEQGAAKSTLEELIKDTIDPSEVKTLTFSPNLNELTQKLSHNYIAYFDNVSYIPDWISDELCREVAHLNENYTQTMTI
jgi:ABC-type Mn2+/Zn2+ transport system ATPase subunit